MQHNFAHTFQRNRRVRRKEMGFSQTLMQSVSFFLPRSLPAHFFQCNIFYTPILSAKAGRVMASWGVLLVVVALVVAAAVVVFVSSHTSKSTGPHKIRCGTEREGIRASGKHVRLWVCSWYNIHNSSHWKCCILEKRCDTRLMALSHPFATFTLTMSALCVTKDKTRRVTGVSCQMDAGSTGTQLSSTSSRNRQARPK